jgi:hypothetical protein
MKRKSTVGKPTLHHPRMDEEVYKLALLGATDQQIADFFDVSIATINNWKHKEASFAEYLRKGKDEADAKVVESLFRRATGYAYDEVQTVEGINADGVHYGYTRKTSKHVAGDVKAQIFWLTNRQRDQWSKVTEHKNTNSLEFNVNKTLELKGLSDEQKTMIKDIAIKQISTVSGISDN